MRDALEAAVRNARGGRLAEALASVRAVVRTQPNDLEARTVLGFLLSQAGEHDQAAHHLARVAGARPGDPQALNNLANALMAAGRPKEAADRFRAANEAAPAYRPAWNGRCMALLQAGDAAAAVEASGLALRHHGPWPELMLSRSGAMLACDRVEEAIPELERAVEAFPSHALLRGSLLLALNGIGAEPVAVAAAHRGYAQCVPERAQPPAPDPDPDRPIVVGILSADLRTHSVAYFARAIVEHRPPDVRLVAFSTAAQGGNDPMTAALRARFDAWVEAGTLDDAALDHAIREHHVDVLLELNGHTAGNRLTALDRKPAPLIVSAIGYPNTTGHPCIDLRIVDSATDPPGTDDRCTERLVRLDPCFLCYAAPADAPPPEMPAADAPPTFGSFNETKKLRAETVALWAPLLREVPEARLVIKARAAAEPVVRESLLRRLAAGGIEEARVDILPFAPDTRSHLAQYGRVHVALDSTPYNGTTTTCEALWMGVPVVSLAGDRHAARVGASLLPAAGVPELVARTPDEFTAIAAGLVRDRARLEALRHGLRARVAASALADGAAYGRRFHGALRQCWREWCARSRA